MPDPLPDEYWAVGLGHRGQGHVVVEHMVVAHNRTLLDLTIGQAARPGRGINLPPAFHGRFKSDPATAVCRMTFAVGSVVEYDPQPFNRSYLSSDWWSDHSQRRGIVESAIAKILNQKIRGMVPA